jgi:hypothetical protein
MEYFFTFLPAELVLHPDYVDKPSDLNAWADSSAVLIDAPPRHWVENPELYGSRVKISSDIIANGLVLPVNWIEWLCTLRVVLNKMNWYIAFAVARKQPYIEAISLLDTISNMLEGTAVCNDKIETAAGAKEMARDYALYHIDTFSQKISEKYLASEVIQKEQSALARFSSQVIDIINDENFKADFLQYVLVDKKKEDDLVQFILPDRINQLLRTAFAAIVYHPSEQFVNTFYTRTILPVELKLGNTLDQGELDAIKDLFIDTELINQFLPGLTESQKNDYRKAVSAGLQPLFTANELSALEKEIPCITKTIEDMEPKNPVWNWIKDSANDTIDEFLGAFLQMRESWATDAFDKSPKLGHTAMSSIKRSIVAFRITSAAYKNYKSASGGTTSKVLQRSAKDYINFIKGRMTDKEKWLKDADGKTLGSTPVNLNMAFSAIGIVVSIQGIYSFYDKCRNREAGIDEWVDLFKSLSSGASSLMGLLPDKISESPLAKSLGGVFKPVNAVCDIHAAIKLIRKSQLYYAQRDIEKTLFTGIEAGLKMGSAGFTLLTLFRWKSITNLILKREMLLQAGSKAVCYSFTFAMMGCEAFKWYLKYIEPKGSKIAKQIVENDLDSLINNDPRKKVDTVKKEVHGVVFNVPKINYFEEDLKWKDSPRFRQKEIYCDPERNWDWLKLRDFILDEMTGVPPIKGLGWVSEFDENKAMFELLERGVQVEAVEKICRIDKETIERNYRDAFVEKRNKIDDQMLSKIDKANALQKLLS